MDKNKITKWVLALTIVSILLFLIGNFLEGRFDIFSVLQIIILISAIVYWVVKLR